MLSTELSMSNA